MMAKTHDQSGDPDCVCCDVQIEIKWFGFFDSICVCELIQMIHLKESRTKDSVLFIWSNFLTFTETL